MKLVERTYINKSHLYFKIIDNLAWKSKNLFNLANYQIRQKYFTSGQYIGFFDLYHLLKQEEAYKDLPTKVSKQIVKRVAKTWKGFIHAHRNWQRNPDKYLGEPRIPKYLDKEKGRYLLIYPPDAISRPYLKKGIVKLSMVEVYLPTQITEHKVLEIRFVSKQDCYVMEVVYEVDDLNFVEIDTGVVAGLDLGINNLCTIATNRAKIQPLIINGRGLKSINRYFNKVRAYFQSKLERKRSASKRLRLITQRRNCQIESAMHNASRQVINYCLENQVSTLVIGYNSNWKQEVNLGKKTNQQFVQLPHRQLINLITYKAHLVGIKVIKTEENYTSKCSALDLEPIHKHESYVGKRVMRGLFRTAKGLLILSDWNGALNMIRKVFSDEMISELIEALPLCPRVINPV